MDIQPLINALTAQNAGSRYESPLQLKVGQQVDVKVGPIDTELNRITLALAKQTLEVQSNLTVPLQPGQTLKLEVMQSAPVLILRLLEPKLAEAGLTFSQVQGAKTDSSSLPLVSPANAKTADLPTPILARVLDIKEQSIRLELLSKPQETTGRTVEIAYKAGEPPVKPGQLVTLETGPPNTGNTFKIIRVENEIAEFVRRFLPKNESPVTTIRQLLKDNTGLQANDTLTIPLKRLVGDILHNLPRHEDLSQYRLIKHIIADSGLFLEAKLARFTGAAATGSEPDSGPETPAISVKEDFKAQLLKLIQTLKLETAAEMEQTQSTGTLEQLKNLLQKSENGLARLILDQLASVPKEETPKQQWHMEIPFLNRDHADSVKIQIDKDQHARQEERHQQTWSVTLTLSPPNIGPLRCKIAFFDKTVNTHFAAEQSQTTELIKRHLDHLKQQLEQAGLKTGHIEAGEGPIAPTPNRLTTASLLNEKA